MEQSISVPRGTVVGIGKIKIPRTQEFDYEIQLLSFLDVQKPEGSFISTCINLRIDGYGKTQEEAEEDMVENVYYFLRHNFEQLSTDDAWNNLRDLFKADEWSNKLREAYQEAKFQLSMQGTPTDNIHTLFKRLEALAKQVKKLEARVKDMETEEARQKLASELMKLCKDLIVSRTSFIKKVAA